MIDVSIIICTRNRAEALRETLKRFERLQVIAGRTHELVIVDNGSTDATAEVIEKTNFPEIEIRRVLEPKPGLSRARNAGVRASTGKAILFTDDDVEPSVNWISLMALPILNHECDAIAGRILLSPTLHRSWQTRMHRVWLAEKDVIENESPELVGANMAIARKVFEKIPQFDEELGAGALGFGEETLFWLQMKELKMRIRGSQESLMIHHPELSRLLGNNWLSSAEKHGKSMAYIKRNWEHSDLPNAGMNSIKLRIKLGLRRWFSGRANLKKEGCPEWEMSYLSSLAMYEHFKMEAGKQRKYPLKSSHKLTEITPR